MARASLEELRLDYEDFLRQRGYEVWGPDHPALRRFKARRCSTLDEVRGWVQEERQLSLDGTTEGGRTRTNADESQSVSVSESPNAPILSKVLVANAALSLLNLSCYLLDCQIAAQAKAFEDEGGFTERLYRVRTSKRRRRK